MQDIHTHTPFFSFNSAKSESIEEAASTFEKMLASVAHEQQSIGPGQRTRQICWEEAGEAKEVDCSRLEHFIGQWWHCRLKAKVVQTYSSVILSTRQRRYSWLQAKLRQEVWQEAISCIRLWARSDWQWRFTGLLRAITARKEVCERSSKQRRHTGRESQRKTDKIAGTQCVEHRGYRRCTSVTAHRGGRQEK